MVQILSPISLTVMELKHLGEEGFDLRHCEKWMRSSAVQQNLAGSNDSTSWRLNTRR